MLGHELKERYVIECEIGRGGMGVVYKGNDRQLGRMVAIKVLPVEFSHDQQFLQRFKNEILNSARLDHPNIVQVYDVGEEAGMHYYVMQLVDGTDLHHKIQHQGSYSVSDTVDVLIQIAKALDYAHQHGVVHRDIKPDNILIDSYGTARVVDFGIARSIEGTRMTGGMLGTPEYMSPEQARGDELDGKSDQYSLALVAYEMLTGTTPFRSTTAQPWAMVNMHLTVQPPDPRQYTDTLSENVANSLIQALAKVPESRFNSCVEFVQALQGLVPVTLPQFGNDSSQAKQDITFSNSADKELANNIESKKRVNNSIGYVFTGIVVVLLLAFGGILIVNPKIINFQQKNDQPVETAIVSQPSAPLVNPPPSGGQEKVNVTNNINTTSPKPPEPVINKPVIASSPVEISKVNDNISSPILETLSTDEIDTFINQWSQAWMNKDISSYQQCYDPERFIGTNVSGKSKKTMHYDDWMKDKRVKFGKAASIYIEITNKTLNTNEQGQSVIQFTQTYRSDKYQDLGNKELIIEKRNGVIQIVKEDFNLL
ncbi:MAG: serine/threonine-protein kinase [bacterium]